MKRRRLTALLLALLLLTGCTKAPVSTPAPSLPPVEAPFDPPVGDARLTHDALAVLYLPATDGQRLLAYYEPMVLTYSQHPAEAILKALLSHPGNTRMAAIGGDVALSLAGTDPVEVAGGVCTVNLAPSALQLSQEALHTACQAIAATLCELADISHVNILVAGQAVPMDVTGSLPLGAITAQVAQELPVLYEQLAARRAPVGVQPSTMPLTATATLYFPLEGGAGIVPEVRRLSFPGQHPQQLALGLMAALADGAQERTGTTRMPDFAAMLLSTPEVTDLESGGKQLTLHFPTDMKDRLQAMGIDPACCFAALTHTLATFVPSLQQVCILLGDGALTSLHSDALGSRLFPGGVLTRADFSGFLVAQAVLWHQEDGQLAAHVSALPYRRARDPRTLLLTLAAAPAGHEVLPAGLTDADVLGFAIAGDTLLIHLSPRYQEAIREANMDQRVMAYAVVGTMCENLPVRRVRFYFGNEQPDTLGDSLVWGGEFLHRPGLVKNDPVGGIE